MLLKCICYTEDNPRGAESDEKERMDHMKKYLSLALALAMALSLSVTAFAVPNSMDNFKATATYSGQF